MTRRFALSMAAAVLLGAAAALAWVGTETAGPGQPARWAEVPWPFAMDPFGKGKAYQCNRADCGAEVTLYVRAKVGFCNCTTGVADDEELERISDLDFIGPGLAAAGDGRQISVAWMKGRSRAYAGPGAARPAGLSIAVNDRCDAIVATAVLNGGQAAAVEPVVLDFLNSTPVLRWAQVTLGL